MRAMCWRKSIALSCWAACRTCCRPANRAIAIWPALPDEEFRGRLKFIYPHVDQASRTLTVRFEIENPEHKLRPGSTASIRLFIPPQKIESLAVVGMSDLVKEELAKGRVLAVPQG